MIDSAVVVGDVVIGFGHIDGIQEIIAQGLKDAEGRSPAEYAGEVVSTLTNYGSFPIGITTDKLPPMIDHTIHVVNFNTDGITVALHRKDDRDLINPFVVFPLENFLSRHGL